MSHVWPSWRTLGYMGYVPHRGQIKMKNAIGYMPSSAQPLVREAMGCVPRSAQSKVRKAIKQSKKGQFCPHAGTMQTKKGYGFCSQTGTNRNEECYIYMSSIPRPGLTKVKNAIYGFCSPAGAKQSECISEFCARDEPKRGRLWVLSRWGMICAIPKVLDELKWRMILWVLSPRRTNQSEEGGEKM